MTIKINCIKTLKVISESSKLKNIFSCSGGGGLLRVFFPRPNRPHFILNTLRNAEFDSFVAVVIFFLLFWKCMTDKTTLSPKCIHNIDTHVQPIKKSASEPVDNKTEPLCDF